jgi:hypothetical protein
MVRKSQQLMAMDSAQVGEDLWAESLNGISYRFEAANHKSSGASRANRANENRSQVCQADALEPWNQFVLHRLWPLPAPEIDTAAMQGHICQSRHFVWLLVVEFLLVSQASCHSRAQDQVQLLRIAA